METKKFANIVGLPTDPNYGHSLIIEKLSFSRFTVKTRVFCVIFKANRIMRVQVLHEIRVFSPYIEKH